MTRQHKPYRPRTPLLFVLLGAAVLVAATTLVASHFEMITTRILEPLVTTALVAAYGATRIFVR